MALSHRVQSLPVLPASAIVSAADRWITARHEAGHAVVAHQVGVPYGALMICPVPRADGVTGWMRYLPIRPPMTDCDILRRLLRLMCVDVAAMVTPGASEEKYYEDGFAGDLDNLQGHADALCLTHQARIVASVQRLTRRVVMEAEPAIQALAELAFRSPSGRLAAREIRACLASTLPPEATPVQASELDALFDVCRAEGCLDSWPEAIGGEA